MHALVVDQFTGSASHNQFLPTGINPAVLLSLPAGWLLELEDLQDAAVSKANAKRQAMSFAVLDEVAKTDPVAEQDGLGGHHPGAHPLDVDQGVNIHPGSEQTVYVGEIDLGPQRPLGRIERPRSTRDFPLELLIIEYLNADASGTALFDADGVGLRHFEKYAHLIGPDHYKQRLTLGASRRGLQKMASVNAPIGDDTIEGGCDSRILEHLLELAFVGLRDKEVVV